MDMMKTMMDRLGKLEAGGSKNVAPSGANSGRQSWKPRDPPTSQETEVRAPITCYRCGKEGHYARGCAVRRGSRQGNYQPSAPRGGRAYGGKVKEASCLHTREPATLGAKGHACEGKVKDAPNLDITSINPVKVHKVQGRVNNSQALFVLDTGAALSSTRMCGTGWLLSEMYHWSHGLVSDGGYATSGVRHGAGGSPTCR